MKKIFFFFLTITTLSGISYSQDTVRYGDPWYAFRRPMPRLIDGLDYSLYNEINLSAISTQEGTHRSYLGYINDNYSTIYGIAVVMDSLPRPEHNYIVTLLRGIKWHNFYSFSPSSSVPSYYYTTIVIDSLCKEDTINLLNDPLVKQCRFEYFYDYDSVTGIYKSSAVNNCYEFFFDSPLIFKDTELNGLFDTFFVGVNLRPVPTLSTAERITITPKVACADVYSQIYLQFVYAGIVPPYSDSIFAHYDRPGNPYIPFMIPSWGGIFPIIERRCSVPRGLTLADDSLSVHWRSDTDAEFFQLSVCADTVEPDFGRLFTTSSTALALPTLHPDSTYHIYLRKQCAFRQDSVWSDWSAPLTIGNGSAAIDDVSISNFQFSVFPNPASSDITVKVSGDQEPVATLLDATGRTVIPPTPFHSSFLIPRSSLSPGVYLLRLHTATGVATKKLIVK